MAEILVGTDGSERSTHAVRWAAGQAHLHELPLRIVHALPGWLYEMPDDSDHGQVGRWAREDSTRMLDEAANQARADHSGLAVTTQLLSGDARTVLLDAARKASLLVVAGRGEGGFAGLLLGSVAHGVASSASCPVVVVHGPPAEDTGEIVVGVDCSKRSRTALGVAFAEASLRGVPLRAVYAWRPAAWILRGAWPHNTIAAPPYDTNADIAEADERLAAANAEWTDRYPEVKVVEQLHEGHPVQALVQASANADLLIVGTHGRGSLAGLLLGSVSHGVLHHAKCPVMIVPT